MKDKLDEMEGLVMLDTERKEELVMAKNLRACSTPFRPQVLHCAMIIMKFHWGLALLCLLEIRNANKLSWAITYV